MHYCGSPTSSNQLSVALPHHPRQLRPPDMRAAAYSAGFEDTDAVEQMAPPEAYVDGSNNKEEAAAQQTVDKAAAMLVALEINKVGSGVAYYTVFLKAGLYRSCCCGTREGKAQCVNAGDVLGMEHAAMQQLQVLCRQPHVFFAAATWQQGWAPHAPSRLPPVLSPINLSPLATGAAPQGAPHGALTRRCNCGQPHQARKGKEHRLHVRRYYVRSYLAGCLGALLCGWVGQQQQEQVACSGGHFCNFIVCFCSELCTSSRSRASERQRTIAYSRRGSIPMGSVITSTTSPTWVCTPAHSMPTHPPPVGRALQHHARFVPHVHTMHSPCLAGVVRASAFLQASLTSGHQVTTSQAVRLKVVDYAYQGGSQQGVPRGGSQQGVPRGGSTNRLFRGL